MVLRYWDMERYYVWFYYSNIEVIYNFILKLGLVLDLYYIVILIFELGIGDWGLGIGDWGLGPIPNPQSPIPNPQYSFVIILYVIVLYIVLYILIIFM